MDSFKIKAERKSLWSYCWTSDGSALPVFLHQSLVSFPVFFVSVTYYCLKKKKKIIFLPSSVVLRADALFLKWCLDAVVTSASSAFWNTLSSQIQVTVSSLIEMNMKESQQT